MEFTDYEFQFSSSDNLNSDTCLDSDTYTSMLLCLELSS